VGQSLPTSRHAIFRALGWGSNLLLALAFVTLIYSCVQEYSVRRYLDGFSDWRLLLERESFFYVVTSAAAFFFLLLMPTLLGWYADRPLRIPRFHLREHAVRAGAAFLSAPEINE
jgi:hypothetical protein